LNSRAEILLGRKREDLLSKEIWDVFPKDEEGELFGKLQAAAAKDGEHTFEAFSAKVGRWLEVSVNRAEAGVYVYFRDITDRRRREENMAFLSEITSDLAVD
jgi:PAS domain S-box-containing protein